MTEQQRRLTALKASSNQLKATASATTAAAAIGVKPLGTGSQPAAAAGDAIAAFRQAVDQYVVSHPGTGRHVAAQSVIREQPEPAPAVRRRLQRTEADGAKVRATKRSQVLGLRT